jgi:hypothetical protein
MIERAQQVIWRLRTRVSSTLQLAADLGDSVGVPSKVTTLLRTGSRVAKPQDADHSGHGSGPDPMAGTHFAARDDSMGWRSDSPLPHAQSETAEVPGALDDTTSDQQEVSRRSRRTTRNVRAGRKTVRQKGGRKRSVTGNHQLPDGVAALQVDDAIEGSTYLARIVWALGVAQLEGAGPLRPADIARMIMARSPVSLEPPNVARYIRRSNPPCLTVSHSEGSSNYYRLNAEGKRLFNEHFCSS